MALAFLPEVSHPASFLRIQYLVGAELDSIVEKKPRELVAPNKQRPSPADRRHEYSINIDEGCHVRGREFSTGTLGILYRRGHPWP